MDIKPRERERAIESKTMCVHYWLDCEWAVSFELSRFTTHTHTHMREIKGREKENPAKVCINACIYFLAAFIMKMIATHEIMFSWASACMCVCIYVCMHKYLQLWSWLLENVFFFFLVKMATMYIPTYINKMLFTLLFSLVFLSLNN